ncbi:MAG: hypothetical protein HZA53_00680, partial [Planctomycetes bacterium]|nr:hypothetical protein [Planctomycetota bacterium]
REDERAFAARLVEIVERRSVRVVLAGAPHVAHVLARHAKVLARAGAKLLGSEPEALARLREKGLAVVGRGARIATVPAVEVPAQPTVASFLSAAAWPIALLADDGARRRASDAIEALNATRALYARGARHVRRTSPAFRRLFEVLLVVARDGRLLGACAVRVLEDDERMRPWIAVTVDDVRLERAAHAVAARCALRGPVTVTLQADGEGFVALDAQPGLPVWIEACLREGPNLVALCVAATLDARARPAGRVPAGTLFSQTAQDVVLDPRSSAAAAILTA